MYRFSRITIRKEDRPKADEIILEHWSLGDIDEVRVEEFISNGVRMTTYRLRLYVSEDLKIMVHKLKLNGIELF